MLPFSEMAIYLLCDSKIVMEEQKKDPDPLGSPWGLTRRIQVSFFLEKSPILLDLPGVVTLFIFEGNEVPL